MKFKKGDRVVAIEPYFYGEMGVVSFEQDPLQVHLDKFGERLFWQDMLISEEVYNSELYKALNELV